jgi:hypothetical protein
MNARNLPKPVHVTLRTKDKVAKSPDKLLKLIKDLNPGLHTEHWRILDKQPEPKGERLNILIHQDSHTAIKGTGYKILTGLSRGTVKVLRDPEIEPQQEKEAAMSPESSESVL